MKLVITEKPSVAKSISKVIGAKEQKNGYLEGNGYLVSWCVGHLVGLARPEEYGEQWRKWSYESLPILPERWKYTLKADTKKQYEILRELLHRDEVSAVICATDAGREGELIFRLVYAMAKCKKPVERLWISSLEEGAIREGFAHLKPGKEYDSLYDAALCRQQADWLVGINGTRLFTVLYGGRVLKVGRVQTPTLAMLVEREERIQNFQKETYYIISIQADGIAATSEPIKEKEKAEKVLEACRGKEAVIRAIQKEEKTAAPPKLYDLTTLQREANRLFGFTAKQTLEYTQSLYEKKLVTYPRTDSSFLSDDMEQTAVSIIEVIWEVFAFPERPVCCPDIKRVLNSKKVTDHHAIIPTMELVNVDLAALPETERNILSLVAGRLLCATGKSYLYEMVKAEISCNEYVFTASGKVAKQEGWKGLEAMLQDMLLLKKEGEKNSLARQKENRLLELMEGQRLEQIQAEIRERDTQPLKHFTEGSLLLAMEQAGKEEMGDEVERKGLGTPATRADIIEKLVKDGFVKREKIGKGERLGSRLIPTEEGQKLITVLPDMVKSPKLTADWENALVLVAKGELSKEKFMEGIEKMVSELVHLYQEAYEEKKSMSVQEQKVLGVCPNCGGQVLKGRYGAYCKERCGMNVGRVMGVVLTEEQVKELLEGKKILLKGLKSKAGKEYDAFVVPEGIEEFSYQKDGEEKRGVQFKVVMEFPKKNGLK